MRHLEIGGDYYCYGLGFAPNGRHVVMTSPFMGVYLVPLGGGPARRILDFTGQRLAPIARGLRPSRPHVAVASTYAAASRRPAPVRPRPRSPGAAHLPDRGPRAPADRLRGSSAYSLKFLADGSPADGRRRAASGAGTSRAATARPVGCGVDGRFAVAERTDAGRTIVALVGGSCRPTA